MNEIKQLYALEWLGPYDSIEDVWNDPETESVPYILSQERNRTKEVLNILNTLELPNEILQRDYPTRIILKNRKESSTKSIGWVNFQKHQIEIDVPMQN